MLGLDPSILPTQSKVTAHGNIIMKISLHPNKLHTTYTTFIQITNSEMGFAQTNLCCMQPFIHSPAASYLQLLTRNDQQTTTHFSYWVLKQTNHLCWSSQADWTCFHGTDGVQRIIYDIYWHVASNNNLPDKRQSNWLTQTFSIYLTSPQIITHYGLGQFYLFYCHLFWGWDVLSFF